MLQADPNDVRLHMNRMFLSHSLFCFMMIYWVIKLDMTKSLQIIVLTISQMFLTNAMMYKPKSCVMNLVDLLSWVFIVFACSDVSVVSFASAAVTSFVMSKIRIPISAEFNNACYVLVRVISLLLFVVCFYAEDIFLNNEVQLQSVETNMIRMLFFCSNLTTRWLIFGLHECNDNAHFMTTMFDIQFFCILFVLLVVWPDPIALYTVFGIAGLFRIASVLASLREMV